NLIRYRSDDGIRHAELSIGLNLVSRLVHGLLRQPGEVERPSYFITDKRSQIVGCAPDLDDLGFHFVSDRVDLLEQRTTEDTVELGRGRFTNGEQREPSRLCEPPPGDRPFPLCEHRVVV